MRKFQRAFSLAEIIIAMTIVVMISGVGFLSCVIASRIRANAVTETKAYLDAEKFRVSIETAFDDVGRDPEQKDEFFKQLLGNLEWNFEADGLYAAAGTHNANEEAWTVEVPILKDSSGEPTRTITIYYLGPDNGEASYYYQFTITDVAYSTKCLLNCRTSEFGGTITAKRNNSSSDFYESTYNYGN